MQENHTYLHKDEVKIVSDLCMLEQHIALTPRERAKDKRGTKRKNERWQWPQLNVGPIVLELIRSSAGVHSLVFLVSFNKTNSSLASPPPFGGPPALGKCFFKGKRLSLLPSGVCCPFFHGLLQACN